MYDIFGDMSSKGLSDESLKKLPHHEITKERLGIHEEDLSCTVCLQVSKLMLHFVITLLCLYVIILT